MNYTRKTGVLYCTIIYYRCTVSKSLTFSVKSYGVASQMALYLLHSAFLSMGSGQNVCTMKGIGCHLGCNPVFALRRIDTIHYIINYTSIVLLTIGIIIVL